ISYVQGEYEEQVNARLHSALNNLTTEVRRQFDNERQALLALADSTEIENFTPALAALADDEVHPHYSRLYRNLSQFLRAFSSVQPGLHTLRVLDVSGNTVLKVHQGRSSERVLENFSGLPYVEQEVLSEGFARSLGAIAVGEVANLLLPQRKGNTEFLRLMPMLDHVVAVEREGQRLGYLTVSYEGEFVDRILDYAPRDHGSRLSLVELNPDETERNGMLLYADHDRLRLSQVRYDARYLQTMHGGEWWSRIEGNNEGMFLLQDGQHSLHFMEFQPYRNTLVSWLLVQEVDRDAVVQPFAQIRVGILLLVALALIISLIITRMGSRRIADPVCELASNLKAYADGRRTTPIQPKGVEEILQLGQSFNYMADTLSQARNERDKAQSMMLQTAKLASVGQLAAGIGHELNNPLNNILSYAKLMERDLAEDDGRIRADLASLREEALRASDIVRGILNFSRQMPAQLSHFLACEWLDETLKLVKQEADKGGINIQCECDSASQLHGDRSQLQQVLVNILINAIQASARDSVIRIALLRQDGAYQLEVSDNGIGIDESDLDKLFDPFFTTKAVGEGSGLGLSISLGIIEQHGGMISIENLDSGGVKVSIHLPQQQETA
ncbi:MAG: HAMP domain-containing histidine kinase, partial [Gammaproteobacteria bacterium]|nr:HAMP domain-containing histidine kinase [Gammaproteobacteria bacterium]